MAFTIKLQQNLSENNKVDKEIIDILSLSGTLRADTSIVDPIVIFEADLASLINCNYMTITSFGRSYFVRDIRSIRNGLVEITGHCDVISSFKAQIRECTGIVKRQENDWNLYLNDGSFKTYQYKSISTYKFPNGFPESNDLVLAVAGPTNIS